MHYKTNEMEPQAMRNWLKVCVEFIAIFYFVVHSSKNQLTQVYQDEDLMATELKTNKTIQINSDGTYFEFDRNSKVVFIGGVSGVNGLAKILDLHSDIRCGKPNDVVTKVLMVKRHL